METIKISALTAADTLEGDELFPLVQDGTTKAGNIRGSYYGDAINSTDILFAEGVANSASSNGVMPIKDVALFVPGIHKIDSEQYDNEMVPYPGRRGARYYGVSRTNQISGGNSSTTWAGTGTGTVAQNGKWVEIDGGATGSSGGGIIPITLTGAYKATLSIFIHNTDDCTESYFGIASHYIRIVWATPSLVGVGTATVLDYTFHTSALLEIVVSVDSTVASNNFLVFPDIANNNKTINVMNPLAVDFASDTPYVLPYFEGVLPASKWVEYVDWEESSSWTLQNEFVPGADATEYVFDTQNVAGDYGFAVYNNAGTYILRARTLASGAAALSTQPTVGSKNNLKIVFVSGTSVKAYLDGALVATLVTNIPTVAQMDKVLNIGMKADETLQLNGLIQDFLLRPSADETTTHYDLDEPWIDSRNRYSYNGMRVDNWVGHNSVDSLISNELLAGEFELIWSGADATPSAVLERGTYKTVIYLTSGNTDKFTSLIHFDESDNSYGSSFYDGTAADYIVPVISSGGVPTLNAGGSYSTAEYKEIWKQV